MVEEDGTLSWSCHLVIVGGQGAGRVNVAAPSYYSGSVIFIPSKRFAVCNALLGNGKVVRV